MDYIEATQIRDDVENYFVPLKPIWPWEGYFNYLTKEGIRLDYVQAYRRNVGWEEKIHNSQDAVESFLYGDSLAKKMGYEDYFQLRHNEDLLHPMIPDDIFALCRWLCLFNDDDTIYDLKPIMYIWWE